MTVETTDNVVVHQGNGATTVFPFPFRVVDADHMLVESRNETTGVVTTVDPTDYTVSGLDAILGGSVTLDTALASGYELIISRTVPYTQELDIVNQGGFYPDTLEAQLDLMTMGLQQLDDQMGRTIRAPFGLDGLEYDASETDGVFGLVGGEIALLGTGDLQGDPGGNVMSIGTKATATGLTIAVGTELVQTSGYATAGDGGQALYIYDATVDASYVATYPRTAFISANSRGFRLVDSQLLNIKMFGAKGDASISGGSVIGTDDRLAFVALNTFCNRVLVPTYGAGRECRIPLGRYYVSSKVTFDNPVRLVGEQGGGTFPWNKTSSIVSPAGKSAFFFIQGVTSYSTSGFIENLSFEAAGFNTNSTTGSGAMESRTITLAAISDFANDDDILIRGAALEGVFRGGPDHPGGVTATTAVGSPVIQLSLVDGEGTGAYVGMVLSVAGAGFTADSKVLSVDTALGRITMNSNATTLVTGAAITVYGDLLTYIVSGGGTTTLTLGAKLMRTVTNVEVRHGATAVHCLTTFHGRNVEFVGYDVGLAVLGDDIRIYNPDDTLTNANNSHWDGVTHHGCRIGILNGYRNANDCRFSNINGYSNLEYSIVDNTFLGSAWGVGVHCSGPYGVLHIYPTSQSLFLSLYVEGGCICSFGPMATGLGLQPTSSGGGQRFVPSAAGLGAPQMLLYPYGFEVTKLQVSTGSANLARGIFNIDNSGQGGTANTAVGWYTVGAFRVYDYSATKLPFAWSDSDHTLGAGHFFNPHGIQLGNDTADTVAANFIRMLGGTAAPVAGTWKRGDHVFNKDATVGQPKGWICTVAGTPGTWVSEGNL